MKCQYYVMSALMLVSGIACSDGYQGYYRSNPYRGYANPYSPSNPAINAYPANAPRIYRNQGSYQAPVNNNPYVPNSVSRSYGRYGTPYSPTSPNTPYTGGNPYTPYSTPNPHGSYVNPYSSYSNNAPYAANTPYAPGNAATPNGIYDGSSSAQYAPNNSYNTNNVTDPSVPYASPYNPNSVISPYAAGAGEQQFYDSQGNYRGTLSAAPYNSNAVSTPYGSPYSPDSFNSPYESYGPDNSQFDSYDQGVRIYGE